MADVPPAPTPRFARRRLLAAAGISVLGPALHAAPPDTSVLHIAGSQIELQFDEEGFSTELRALALQWAQRSAGAVAQYLGRFPLPEAELLLQAVEGAGVKGGTTFSEPAPYVRVRLGTQTTAQQFENDWVLVHEMLHLAVPRVARAQNWLHEGIATYCEGVARVRAGLLGAERFWREAARSMPLGQPQTGDAGLDHTPTWGRTYWGGAMFCLLADVQIRQRSGGRVGLEHALQGVLAAGGSYAVAWPAERTLAVADAAVGQQTLSELRARYGSSTERVDLDTLFAQLGVAERGPLREDALLSGLRRQIA
jgi:hypothetical protein